MLQTHRIAVADSDLPSRAELVNCLIKAGHNVAVQAASAVELTERSRNATLDLIVADGQLPGLEQLAGSSEIPTHLDLPVVALWKVFDDRTAESTCCSSVFAHLMKPIREAELLAAVPLAIRRFLEFRTLREETISMQRALEERKLIERAKGIVMRHQTIDEATAFRQLQQLARNHRLKMADLARSIILAHEALDGPEGAVPRSSLSNLSNQMPRRQSG